MSKHITSDGQDFFDIAIQRYGNIEQGLFQLIEDNEDLTLDDNLSSGDEFIFDSSTIGDKQTISYFNNRKFVINNADEKQLETILGEYNGAFSNAFRNNTL